MENQFDKQTLDQVMLDLNKCIEKWESLNLDTQTTIVALLEFSMEVVFKHAQNTEDALGAISGMLLNKLESGEIDPDVVERMFDFYEVQNGSIH
jgi:hypothetical protein|tara:strand:- start:143 stop:424 length:282 start_codon:yes stop_codon:yes gene_type:complete